MGSANLPRMHAWRGHSFGPPETLVWEEIPDPPLEGWARCASRSRRPPSFPRRPLRRRHLPGEADTARSSPGSRAAGVVVESRLPSLPVGTRVAATLDGAGGYATHVVSGEATVHAIPDAMSFTDAAAMTITYQTAHFALHRRARLEAGEIVLVHSRRGRRGQRRHPDRPGRGRPGHRHRRRPRKGRRVPRPRRRRGLDYTREDLVEAVKRHTRARGATSSSIPSAATSSTDRSDASPSRGGSSSSASPPAVSPRPSSTTSW